jgi:HD superfamily phosphohydrolase
MQRDQRIRDPIHNLISFSVKRDEDILLWKLLNSSPIQRLRRIKQLGFSEFVYPGATHSRFAHVLGAMEMARRMMAAFEKNEVLGSDSTHQQMRKATLAAALIHDVGHGPYSHVFEELSEQFSIEKSHETYTAEIIASGLRIFREGARL